MTTRPNIMLLVAEDAARLQGCYGDPCARTPTLDSLAGEGTMYTNAFSTAPVCAPSRFALVTGKVAFSQGAHHMRSTLRSPPTLFTEHLRAAGYYVNWANKTDFNCEPPPSFADATHEWFDDLANGNLPDQPWFLYHNFGITHESSMWEDKWKTDVRPHLREDELCDPAKVRVPAYLPDTPEVRVDIARHYDALAVQDQQVDRALEALEASGLRENTIVLYLSDHGRGLPREKRWCYDAGIHLPLIIRAPGRLPGGEVSDELVSWLDIAPTLLDLAEAEPIPDSQGRVFLGSRKRPEPDHVFAGRDRMDEVFDRVRAARSRKFHYIRNDFPAIPYAARLTYMEKQQTTQILRDRHACGELNSAQTSWLSVPKPAEEFYDVVNDPDNVCNLADDPDYEGALVEHRAALENFLAKVGDLGTVPERELISTGVVADRLEEYCQRIQPLPPHLQIGKTPAPIEMPE